MTRLYTPAEVADFVRQAHSTGFAAGVDHIRKFWHSGMTPERFGHFLECEANLVQKIAKDFDPMPAAQLPSHCPHCETQLEVAEVTTVPFEAYASHYHFKDGTRVICPTYCARPVQCLTCRIRWVSSPPDGKAVPMRF